jgi:hypothetical protein
MMFSSNTCRFAFAFVLVAASNAMAAAKEAKIELPSRRSALRGNSPATTAATVESLAQAHRRMLEESARRLSTVTVAGFAVQAGAGIDFTHPETTIHAGDVCAFGAVTGLEGTHYVFTNENATFPDSELALSSACDPNAGERGDSSLSLFYLLEQELFVPEECIVIAAELGGETFEPGTYCAASLTMADNTEVILKGSGDFHFISTSTMITGANTKVVLEAGTDPSGTPTSANIKWAVAAAATTGASSDVKGSIIAGAAITLGENAKVSGCVLAMAAITVGAGCSINYDLVDPAPLITVN